MKKTVTHKVGEHQSLIVDVTTESAQLTTIITYQIDCMQQTKDGFVEFNANNIEDEDVRNIIIEHMPKWTDEVKNNFVKSKTVDHSTLNATSTYRIGEEVFDGKTAVNKYIKGIVNDIIDTFEIVDGNDTYKYCVIDNVDRKYYCNTKAESKKIISKLKTNVATIVNSQINIEQLYSNDDGVEIWKSIEE